MFLVAIMLVGVVSLWVVWLFLSALLGQDIAVSVLRGVAFAVLVGSLELGWRKYQRQCARTEQRIADLEKKVEELSKRSSDLPKG